LTDRPLIELQLLGSLGATQGSRDLTAAIAQPKRLALLAWLELSRPYGLHPRDTLAGLLWPESPNDKARTALRQLLLVLRRDLGEDIFVVEGELLGINRAQLSSDAGAVLGALEQGDDQRALSAYTGDLLPGLPFAEGEYFERWIEQRRAEIRRAVRSAAWRQVDRAESEDDLPAARRYAERAFAIDSEDEDGLRRMMTIQARSGDRSAALRSHELYTERLRADWGAAPDPETQALVEQIRIGGLSRVPDQRASVSQGTHESADAEPPEAATTPVSQRRHRPTLFALSVLVVAGTAAVFLLREQHRLDPRVERLAVLPFLNHTGNPEHDQLGLMAADWVSRGLVDAGLAEVIPGSVVAQSVSAARASGKEPMRLLVERTGATRLVIGSYYAAGDRIRFHVEVVDAGRQTSLTTIRPSTALPTAAMAAIDSVRKAVLGATAEMLNAGDGWSTGNTPPPSLEMYRLYLRSEDAFRGARWDELVGIARQAWALDSTYPGAGIMLVNALFNLGKIAEADTILRRVQSLPNISPGDAASAMGFRAYLDGDLNTTYRMLARGDSSTQDGGNGRAQLAQDALNLNRPREALRVYAGINWQLAEVAKSPSRWQIAPTAHHLLGAHVEELKAARAIRKRFPRVYWLLELEAAPLAALGRDEDLERLKAEARNFEAGAEDGEYGSLLRNVAADQLWHGDSTKATRTAGEAVAWFESRPLPQAESLRWKHAAVLLMAGRVTDVAALLPGVCAPTDWECHAWTGVVAWARKDTAAALRAEESLSRMRPTPRREEGPRAVGLAAIAAAQGKNDRAVEYLREAHARSIPVWAFHWRFAAFFYRLRGHPGFEELMRPKG
jgi:DNA-binding SARP family transcriptional activator/TolB-like protein